MTKHYVFGTPDSSVTNLKKDFYQVVDEEMDAIEERLAALRRQIEDSDDVPHEDEEDDDKLAIEDLLDYLCRNVSDEEEYIEIEAEEDDEDEDELLGYFIPPIEKVLFQGRATIIFWADGTKTVVKCGEGETMERYMGFTAAVCKKLFGSTTEAKKLCDKLDVDRQRQYKQTQKEAAAKRERDNHEKRVRKEIRKKARELALEMRADALAKEMAARDLDRDCDYD